MNEVGWNSGANRLETHDMFNRPVTAVRGPEPGPPICIVFEYAHTQLTTVQRLERGFDNSFNNILLGELSLTITACAKLRCPKVWENGCVTEWVTRLSPRRLWLAVSTPPWDKYTIFVQADTGTTLSRPPKYITGTSFSSPLWLQIAIVLLCQANMSRPRSNSMTEAFRRRADYAPLIPHSQAIATLAQSNRKCVSPYIIHGYPSYLLNYNKKVEWMNSYLRCRT